MIFSALALIGICYMLAAAWAVQRHVGHAPTPIAGRAPALALLKPLCGAEPMLERNLNSFFEQEYPGAVQVIAGVADANDPALKSFEAVVAAHPDANAAAIVNPARHGPNGKIGNLINIAMEAEGADIIVTADSDVWAPPDALRALIGELLRPGVGGVACLSSGRGDAGPVSEFAAMTMSYKFLPSVALAIALKIGWPFPGPITALRRETLDAIGGFAAYRHTLAEDYEIGRAVRALGMRLAYPSTLVTHCHMESTLKEAVRRELRQNVVIRIVDPAGYAASALTHPFAWALMALAASPSIWTGGLVVASAGARLAAALTIDRIAGRSTAPKWLIPLRDILCFALYAAGFVTRSVSWRGARLALRKGKRIEIVHKDLIAR